ncbi:hypothetical protein RB653_007320 [Dictyostelium firmibasis]|uniref:EngB-type G domain-containing protein n=1 Tax=Dictyostelium firmibasis TaxID=79012 RepID=A0AAN7TNK6_9MYCE
MLSLIKKIGECPINSIYKNNINITQSTFKQQVNHYASASKEYANEARKKELRYHSILKPSYIRFTSEQLLKKKKNSPDYKKKTIKEYLEESPNFIEDLNTIRSPESLIKGPLPIKTPKIEKTLKNEPIFTDETSTETDRYFEKKLQKLMIEQGKENISEVRIPMELVETTLGIKEETTTKKDIQFANMFFNKVASLDTMAIKSVDFPKKTFPQVAFLGKSNVGKSTLLNSILHRDLAYVSKNAGCTKTINFYQLWEKLYLVDLPGYGFAKVSKKKSTVWGNAMSEYLLTSPNLFKVFLLIDSRSQVHKNDIEAMSLLDQHKVAFQIVLTKIDKTTPSMLRVIYNTLKAEIQKTTCCLPTIIQTSAVDSKGIDDIRTTILNVTGMDRETFEKAAANSPLMIKKREKENRKKVKNQKKKELKNSVLEQWKIANNVT